MQTYFCRVIKTETGRTIYSKTVILEKDVESIDKIYGDYIRCAVIIANTPEEADAAFILNVAGAEIIEEAPVEVKKNKVKKTKEETPGEDLPF